MLIDEILAVGDQNFQKKCLSKIYEIRNSGATIVLVSHDTNTVRQLADRIYVMDQGEVIFDGKPDEAIKVYDRRMHERALEIMSETEKREIERKISLLDSSGTEKHGHKVAIERVRILDANNLQELKTDESGKLQIDINIKEDLKESVTVGFSIMKGQLRLTGGNTQLFGLEIKGQGRHSIAFNFNKIPFASGHYSIIAAVHDAKIVECYDIQVNVQTFEIINPKDLSNFDSDIVSPYPIIKSIDISSIDKKRD